MTRRLSLVAGGAWPATMATTLLPDAALAHRFVCRQDLPIRRWRH